jgi:hypothetical protein
VTSWTTLWTGTWQAAVGRRSQTLRRTGPVHVETLRSRAFLRLAALVLKYVGNIADSVMISTPRLTGRGHVESLRSGEKLRVTPRGLFAGY